MNNLSLRCFLLLTQQNSDILFYSKGLNSANKGRKCYFQIRTCLISPFSMEIFYHFDMLIDCKNFT